MKITKCPIPDKYPARLEQCLQILKGIKYESIGFPFVSLDYDYEITKMWMVSFRNPANFSNPDTKSIRPVESCHKMFDFLKELYNKRANEYNQQKD